MVISDKIEECRAHVLPRHMQREKVGKLCIKATYVQKSTRTSMKTLKQKALSVFLITPDTFVLRDFFFPFLK